MDRRVNVGLRPGADFLVYDARVAHRRADAGKAHGRYA
jgi:hypothetical protein